MKLIRRFWERITGIESMRREIVKMRKAHTKWTVDYCHNTIPDIVKAEWDRLRVANFKPVTEEIARRTAAEIVNKLIAEKLGTWLDEMDRRLTEAEKLRLEMKMDLLATKPVIAVVEAPGDDTPPGGE